MDFEANDRTDHNKFAEQLSARLQEQAAPVAEIDIQPVQDNQAGPAPKKTRRARVEAVAPAAAAEIITTVEPPAPIARPVMPGVTIIDCAQNSDEWRRARMGIPTASSFDAIMTPGKTAAQQKTRQTYMYKLAGEIITGQPMDHVVTYDMQRGHDMEPEARDLYTFQTGAELTRVGFIRNGRAGCSPDSLIGTDGGLEIKTKAPHLLIDLLCKGEFPEEHKAQVQGTLWLTERDWWDLVVYWPGMPKFIMRAQRDEAYIANLAAEVARFNDDLDAIVARMKRRIEQETNGLEFAAAAA
jgi:hypothetical protein